MKTITPRTVELLAPAKNLECGIEAVNHGADAVYIGAPQFGARAAATNSIDDIARLVQYAHLYRVKVYVTLNVILKDDELQAAEDLVWQLYRIGVDALIVQDWALKMMNLPPIPLHASTQMDNRTPEKVRFLQQQGYEQVVLARELSLQQIADIHQVCDVPLEVFVHGALCVSYSGQCYVSQHCFGRSANRGECAQFCRLKFNLIDADGRTIVEGKHLLSLKDLNQSAQLEDLLKAGVSSFKIEGRLKDVGYVKNVTAFYRQKLDAILKHHPEWVRASVGKSTLTFEPKLEKSFNRGFTHYFLNGRTPGIFSMHTPKAMGEPVGTVKELKGNSFTVAGLASFANGDGLCFLDSHGVLQGFRVNRVENNRLFPSEMPRSLRPKTPLYRNNDQEFERLLSHPSAQRRLMVTAVLGETEDGFRLQLTDEDGCEVSVSLPQEHQLAKTPQQKQMETQLSKMGNTPFVLNGLTIQFSQQWFVPASLLADLRRRAVDALVEERYRAFYPERLAERNAEAVVTVKKVKDAPFPSHLTYLANVYNRKAMDFLLQQGVERIDPALERCEPKGAEVMFCKHCLRYSMGWCPRQGGERSPYREPYSLVLPDGKRFRLVFDCKNCQMKVVAE